MLVIFHSQICTEHLLYDVDIILSKKYKQKDISIAPETLVTVAALTVSGGGMLNSTVQWQTFGDSV